MGNGRQLRCFVSFLLSFLLAVIATAEESQVPEEWWTHELKVDLGSSRVGNILELKWSMKQRGWVTIEMSAPTQGYIGIGFSSSSSGGMAACDMFLGWVDDAGQLTLHDCHGTSSTEALPLRIDQQNDLEALEHEETEHGTRIRFRRKWDTCDKDDIPITEDTMKLIWAVSESDPENGVLHYDDDVSRGVRSIYMMHHQRPGTDFPEDNPDVYSWDIKMTNHHVPASLETQYFCKIFKFPPLEKKHHLIAYRPILTEGNEQFIHHVKVFICHVPEDAGGGRRSYTTADVFEPLLQNQGHDCYSRECEDCKQYCFAMLISTSVGSEGEILPQDLGVPLDEDTAYLKLEVHYDNPRKRTIFDSSGIRMYYTERLRKNELSVLFTGHRRTPFMTIPPGQEEFKITGFCSTDCTQEGLPEEGITIHSVLLHAHLQGRKIFLRQIRKGMELEPIALDHSYDFHYQQYRTLQTRVKVLPGDELILECTFNTTGTNFVFGGLSTRKEMCEAFIHYYPKVGSELIDCRSQPEFSSYFKPLGIDDYSTATAPSNALKRINLPRRDQSQEQYRDIYNDTAMPDDAYLLEYAESDEDIFGKIYMNVAKYRSQRTLYEYMRSLSWDDKRSYYAKSVQDSWRDGEHYMHCSASGAKKIKIEGDQRTIKPYEPYEAPVLTCTSLGAMDKQSAGLLLLALICYIRLINLRIS